jgi:hypothetical protein
MSPLGGILTLGLALLVLCLPRRLAAVAIIATVCYLTEGQCLEIGFHFTAIRLVLLAGLIRVVSRGELRQVRRNTVDRCIIIYACVLSLIATLRVGSVAELVYQVGWLYNILLSYFVFRSLLRDERDYREVLAKTAFVIIPFALLMLLESTTGRNLFSVFGGVSEVSWLREGHVRSEGSFRCPITAGAFGATFAVLFAGLLFSRSNVKSALIGAVASMLIVSCAHSSGPFLGLVLGLGALVCWPFRRHTRAIRWGIISVLIALQVVMKAPVWFIIARVSDLFGGGGYHRAFLIDQFVNRFSSWWLMGTKDTHDWFPYQLPMGGADLTNIFVSDGVKAGLIGLIISVLLVVRCFQQLGTAMKTARGVSPTTEKMIWGIGATLVGSIGILFSVTYFDQMYVIWYFLLACIAGTELRKSQKSGATPSNNELRKPREILAGQVTGKAAG